MGQPFLLPGEWHLNKSRNSELHNLTLACCWKGHVPPQTSGSQGHEKTIESQKKINHNILVPDTLILDRGKKQTTKKECLFPHSSSYAFFQVKKIMY